MAGFYLALNFLLSFTIILITGLQGQDNCYSAIPLRVKIRVDITLRFSDRLPHSRTNKMEHCYTNNNLKVSSPPMRNILIMYYSIKFRTKCPEKNGKNRRFCKRICIFEIMVFVDIPPLIAGIIMRTTEFSSRRNK